MTYVTIDIEITPSTTKDNSYKVNAHIKGIPNMLKRDRIAWEETSIDLEKWKDLDSALASLDARARGIKEETQVKEFGTNLFQQVMTGAVYTLYRNGKDFASNRGYILRLRLHLGLPELIELPWEFLCEEGIFLGLTKENPRILITRCPIDVKPVRTVEHHLPLKIMIMTAEPTGRPADAKRERDRIKDVLKGVEDEGYVSLKEMSGTNTELENIYKNKTLDIFHFIGHGSFNESTREGELILEDVHRNATTIPAQKFSSSLPNSVKLVFLNACESARGSAHEPFSSIAHLLAKQGHVVIAMQFQISINAAVRFAEIFYSEIAKGIPVDEAIAEGRQRVFTMADCKPLDWAAPVLYMKSANGILFDIKDPSPSIVTNDEEDGETGTETLETSVVNNGKTSIASLSLKSEVEASEGPAVSIEEPRVTSPLEPEVETPEVPVAGAEDSRIASSSGLGVKTPETPEESSTPSASGSGESSTPFGKLKSYRRQHPRLSALIIIICVLLVLVPVLYVVFFRPPTPPNCNASSVLSPNPQSGNATSELNPLVNVPGIKDSMKDACGNVIGLSAGSTIFDTTSPGNKEMQRGATALRNGNLSVALAHFTAVTTTDPSNAEAWIYAENLHVLYQKPNNYIVVVLGLNLTSSRKGSFRDCMQGAYLAQVAYNRSASQNSPSLVLVIANNGANPENTTWVTQQILALKKANSHIVSVVGWPGSTDSINANAILGHQPKDNDNVFMLSPSAASKDLIGYPYFMRIMLTDVNQANYMAEYAYSALNYRKIAVIYTSEDNYASNLYHAFKDAFTKKNGVSLVSEQPFSQGDKASLSTALSNALQSHLDGIYFAGFADDAGVLLSSSQIASLPRQFKILSGSALAVLSDYSRENSDRLVFISNASQDETSRYQTQLPDVKKFLEDYQRTFPSDTMNTNVMLAYDAVNVFLQGYQRALANGGTDTCLPCALQKALQSMNGAQAWQGVSGQIAFNSGSTEPVDKVILINVIENGATKTIDYRGCFLVDRSDCKN